MANHEHFNPAPGFYFKVEVENITGLYEASFQSVSGIDVKMETENIPEGGENKFIHRIPTVKQYSNLVLNRGLIKGSSFIQWINNALTNFTVEPGRVQVDLINVKGDPILQWSFHNTYPVAAEIPEFYSKEDKYAIEKLELAYDYFIRKDL